MRSCCALLLAALACAGTPSTPNGSDGPPGNGTPIGDVVVRGDIEYTGDVAVMESFPVQLAGTVTITNRGSDAETIVFPDGCVALLRAYRPGEESPVWDQASEMGCTMALVEKTLGPGASEEVRTPTASGYDILSDELPDGEYRITIYLRPIGGEPVEIDAGTTQLAIPR